MATVDSLQPPDGYSATLRISSETSRERDDLTLSTSCGIATGSNGFDGDSDWIWFSINNIPESNCNQEMLAFHQGLINALNATDRWSVSENEITFRGGGTVTLSVVP